MPAHNQRSSRVSHRLSEQLDSTMHQYSPHTKKNSSLCIHQRYLACLRNRSQPLRVRYVLLIIRIAVLSFIVMLSKEPPPYNLSGADTRGKILLTTTNDVPGFDTVDVHGVVSGVTVRERGLGVWKPKHRHFEDGEYKLDTACTEQARDQAVSRMVQSIRNCGGNAACGLRFSIEFLPTRIGEVQVVCYATAVTVVKSKG